MASFLKNFADRLFGGGNHSDVLPDDGGLADFAIQFAKQLEHEEKFGRGPTVSADSVLKVQHGRYGSKSYLLDTTDFKKAIMAELRESVAPVTEGILKTRCGEKGKGFMVVKSLYIFHVYNKDPAAEYNAAMDIIDDVGERLLGDRYITGERRINVPVAQIEPEEMFNEDGSFDLKKAKKTINFVRDAGTHGPVNVDWEKQEVQNAQGSSEWVANHVDNPDDNLGDWQTQSHHNQKEDLGEWKTQTHKAADKPKGQWEKVEHKSASPQKGDWKENKPDAAGETDAQEWKSDKEEPKKEENTEVAWGDFDNKPKPKAAPARKAKPKEKTAEPPKANPIGTLTLAFRPTWQTRNEAIDTYAGCVFRKDLQGHIHNGEQIYNDDMAVDMITEIDRLVAEQAARHLQTTQELDLKTIILPFHIDSLLAPKRNSPLKPLRSLQSDFRTSVWIEIIGIKSRTSPKDIQDAIKAHHHKFKTFGLRFDLGDISQSLIDQADLHFLSCDIDASRQYGRQMRDINHDLPELKRLAKSRNLELCTWAIKDQIEFQKALREGAKFINGKPIAKDLRRPGKVIPVSASKLMRTA
ncbi:hypothetical protein RYZ26_01355 [Terasakiella sp. A23]|uniref:hypothetical protein n=1 Tax=Terasakiella sp. FCG-A23 TaxID=3080561 RepID=UPI0029552367|nr:hypothetical protein [Terasakiella sp. A23]MDV7338223.1 hypothetical protein [Terasakiella sp. A23]